jgi:poly-gamma-glutamate capsule biosynthesis protein CapA/YwtB (metallophosphatase superfamily)
MAGELRILLAGDVMTGRGVDQVLACPGDPALREVAVRDAREYVHLAEAANGSIPRAVGPEWPWGDALPVLDAWDPHVRVLNVETSVTTSDDFAPGKAVHYRMHPGNLGCLTVARPDVCVLANNHVLDFGPAGLVETLETLGRAGLAVAGAGRTIGEAQRAAAVEAGGHRVRVYAVGCESSGVPASWAATGDRPGVAYVSDLSAAAADALLARIRDATPPDGGDVVVVSVHAGSNWGYRVPRSYQRFAHRLIDGGVDLVHGHSSHHPRPIEVYRGRPVLYGCGDLINDYEGIGGRDEFRSDLRLLYLVTLDADTHALRELRLVPMRARRLRLERADEADAEWLRHELSRIGRGFGTRVRAGPDGTLDVRARGD